MMEFHISRQARDRYRFEGVLFSFAGNVVFADLKASREFAHTMNQVRNARLHPDRAVHAGALFAMGLIDEVSHLLMQRYREELDPAVMTDALAWFAGRVGADALDKVLLKFVEQFPGASVYRGEVEAKLWLDGVTGNTSHRAAAMEEMLLLWLANRNPAFQPFEELFADAELAKDPVYVSVVENLPTYFATRPLVPVEDAKPQTLFELLRAPVVGAPKSLRAQLDLIRKKWKLLLGPGLNRLLTMAGEVLHEEEIAIWLQFHPPSAAELAEAEAKRRREREQQWPAWQGQSEVPQFDESAHEHERFSADVAWMPTTVMIAKSTYVWLAQMSRQYGRAIDRLDQVPEEELAALARRGMNALWLIGVWERSRASKTIKQMCGNPDAVASAYSLFNYNIAEDLGGEAAYGNLRDRAAAHGIRLASDMVPNHMGIDSPWVTEHPDWFISRWDRPYPAYSFDGPDLSSDGRVEIRIENHYFDQSDAAVVFERRDRASGEVRYIYHGNDGTSFPWNDTAQLDYLNPAVREHVIQTILQVARRFPIIRFDAAMTLAKRHFHRLWFPGPGASGSIPSRAEYGMSNADFNACMPQEFWREVVDRVATEVPGTLLLAEAFWLMEGYFVRTLGMHRVYNSAFMNMMRDEENAKYRMVLKNTLEFDPDIMKRYVNFMSNPDERTAIDQFGDGDKCFGVAAMMATLPGLPMFGHGQVEGFTEKYGMEYRRPRYNEDASHWLVDRHQREIAPLLHQRELFAESGNFLLYDFFTDSGSVDENVFAYSNRCDDRHALVIYNNRYSTTSGTVDWSAAFADKQQGQLRQVRLRDGLGLSGDGSALVAYRDSVTNLEYLRPAWKLLEQGFRVDLKAYQCHVFLNWREMYATAGKPWDKLCEHLNGRGVPDLEDALVGLALHPVHEALRRLLHTSVLGALAELSEHPPIAKGSAKEKEYKQQQEKFCEMAWTRSEDFLREAQLAYNERTGVRRAIPLEKISSLREKFCAHMKAAMEIPSLENYFPTPWTESMRRLVPSLSPKQMATSIWGPILSWCVLMLAGESLDAERPEEAALRLFDTLRLREPLAHVFTGLGFEGEDCWRAAARIKVGLLQAQIEDAVANPKKVVAVEAAEAEAVVDIDDLKIVEEMEPVAEIAKPATDEEVVVKPTALLAEELWQDPDVRWLTGLHETQSRQYFNREAYEDLLWWLQLPELCKLAGAATRDRVAMAEIVRKVAAAMQSAEAAGYCLEKLLRPASSPSIQIP